MKVLRVQQNTFSAGNHRRILVESKNSFLVRFDRLKLKTSQHVNVLQKFWFWNFRNLDYTLWTTLVDDFYYKNAWPPIEREVFLWFPAHVARWRSGPWCLLAVWLAPTRLANSSWLHFSASKFSNIKARRNLSSEISQLPLWMFIFTS